MTSPADLRRLREQVGDVIAKHEAARNIRDFSRYADDPAGFFRDVLHCEPWEKQIEMAEMIRDNPRSVIVTANGVGKDFATARAALWWVYARRGLVVLSGPTERQVKLIVMREVRRAFSRAPELPGELYSMELRVDDSGECGILAFTSDNADRLTGFHHPRLLVCFTEGQGVEEEAFEAAQSCATGPENRLFVYGNPTRPTGPFYRIAHSDHWERLTIRADECPNVISGREEIPGAVSREWILSMREEYGEDSTIYRSRVLAQFPEESVEGLIRREWLRLAFQKWEDGTLDDVAWKHGHTLALDVARYGPDESVLCDVQGPVLRGFHTWRNASLVESAEKVIAYGDGIARATFGQKWAAGYAGVRPTAYVDEPGMGGGAIDVLRSRDYPVWGFNGSKKPVGDFSKRFANERARVHWRYRELLEREEIALSPDPLLEEESLAIEWGINAAGQIQVISKDLLRGPLGRSPDRLDSAIIGLDQSMGGSGQALTITRFYV